MTQVKIEITAFPALNGDSFMVSFNGRYIIIDSGYAETYYKYISDKLREISCSGGCIEKFIITHIDSDHISGSIPLLQEKIVPIKEVWHNTIRHLTNLKAENSETSTEVKQLLRRIKNRGYKSETDANKEFPVTAEQGSTVGAILLKNQFSWNSDFDGGAVVYRKNQYSISKTDYSIYVLSPDEEKLEKLKAFWNDELVKYGLPEVRYSADYDDAFELLLSWEPDECLDDEIEISHGDSSIEELSRIPVSEDKTVTNGSSIAFILEIGTKKLLFLGDAHPGLIFKSLEQYCKDKLYFDFVKISHHGSTKNLSAQLLLKIDSPIFLFSSNGKVHQHPHKQTVARIIMRETTLHTRLYFNYVTPSSQFFDREDWMKKYNYSIHYLTEAPYTFEV